MDGIHLALLTINGLFFGYNIFNAKKIAIRVENHERQLLQDLKLSRDLYETEMQLKKMAQKINDDAVIEDCLKFTKDYNEEYFTQEIKKLMEMQRRTYRLNGNPGDKWRYTATSPEQATADYLHQAGFDSLADYQDYCKVCHISPELLWEIEGNE